MQKSVKALFKENCKVCKEDLSNQIDSHTLPDEQNYNIPCEATRLQDL